MAQDSLQRDPRRSKIAPRRLQVACKHPQESTEEAKIAPKPKENQCVFPFSPFRFRWPPEASRWLQDGPRGPQERPKRVPRRPQERPRTLQERAKRSPRGDFGSSKGGPLIKAHPSLIDILQDGPKRAFKAFKKAARWPQDGPKRAPRGLQEAPRRPPRSSQTPPQGGPNRLPRATQESLRTSRGRQETSQTPQHTSKKNSSEH